MQSRRKKIKFCIWLGSYLASSLIKINKSSYIWLSITQIRRKTKRWNEFFQGNESLSYRIWNFCSESSLAFKVVQEIFNLIFKRLSLILRSSIFWIFKLSRVNRVNEFPHFIPSVTSFKNIWRVGSCSSFFSSIVVKIQASSEKNIAYLSHQGNKIGELKFIQCSIKVYKFLRSEESSKL